MMAWISQVSAWVVPGMGLVSLGVAIWAVIRMRARDERIQVLQRELTELREGEQALGRRLLRLEKRFNALTRKHRELEAEDAQRVSYNEAVRLLQMGASQDELVEACGLSRAEADLLAALQRTDQVDD